MQCINFLVYIPGMLLGAPRPPWQLSNPLDDLGLGVGLVSTRTYWVQVV